MKIKAVLYGRIGIISLALSLLILAFYCFIPKGASKEYIYTIEQIYKYAFLPLIVLGIYGSWAGYKDKIKNIAKSISGYIEAFKIFISANSAQIRRFSLLLFCALTLPLIIFHPFFTFKCFISLLPYLCLLCLIWLFRLIYPQKAFFSSLLCASLLWSVLVCLQTNILSWLNLLRGGIIGSFWLILFFPLLIFILRHRKAWRLPSLDAWDCVPLVIAFFTLIIGILYPPNNYDVLAYHMPRVLHWLQNGSLAPYVASVDRQIGMPPFNSLVALQSFAPFQIDYFVNLGQWLAYAGCVIGARQVTLTLGGRRLAANAAMIFAATLPTAITQASNTESCLMVSYFLCGMAWAWLIWMDEKRPSFEISLIFGLSLGFAILSKGSAYPIAFPFVFVVAWRCIRHPKTAFIQGLLAALLIVLINAPHLYRNLSGEGNLVAGGERNILMHPTPQTFLINAIYNFVSNEPFLLAHGGREALIKFTDKLGIRQDDLEIFPFGGLDYAIDDYQNIDTVTPNPAQAIFVFFVLILIIFRKFHPPLLYTYTVISAFILFCLILTWHAWVARIELSLFLLSAPVCGFFIASLSSEKLRNCLLVLFCIMAVKPLFMCETRAIFSKAMLNAELEERGHFLTSTREELLLNPWPKYKHEYISAAEFIASQKPETVGVKIGTNGQEYPLWVILRDRMGEKMPRLVTVLPGQKEMPSLVFDYERIEQEGDKYPPRVLQYKDGEAKVVFGGKALN